VEVKNHRRDGDMEKVAQKLMPVAAPRGPGEERARAMTLGPPALLGAGGTVLLALASDLPGSPYGPRAGGLWPLVISGRAPGWEGPTVPTWAGVSDQASSVAPGHLLGTLVVVAGVLLLGLAWGLLWRATRACPHLALRRLWWVAAAWVTPLFLAAPFATQDVWTYGAEGRMVLDGFGGYRPASLLGHSVWTLGVDAQWAVRPSLYGPGALDLSALFVKISGGRPWIAAECWRVTTVIGLLLCAWGVRRIVSLRGGNATTATLAVANPAVLVILVGGIHNDALMLGLVVAGMAVAMSGAPLCGILLAALGAAVKPTALVAVAALAWWAFGTGRRQRTRGVLAATAAVVALLVVCGAGVGGGFGWFDALVSDNAVPGPWSLGARFLGVETGWPVAGVEMAGLAVAVLLVLAMRRSRGWVVGLGWGLAAVALTNARPEPWYLAWAVVLLTCGGLAQRAERLGVTILAAMMIGSVLPAGPLWWFSGVVVLGWLGIVWLRTRRHARDGEETDVRPSVSV
jgi:hypothetical protein